MLMKRSMLAALLVVGLVLAGCQSEAEKHVIVGDELQGQGRFEEAIAEYDEAIRLDPQLAVAYNNRGLGYKRLGQPQRAIQDLDEAIRLDHQLAVAYATRALAHTALNRNAEAEEDADRAVELGVDPDLMRRLLEQVRRTR